MNVPIGETKCQKKTIRQKTIYQQRIEEEIIFAGCQGNCPCRSWVQCHKYNDWKFKQNRDDESLEDIHKWYKNNFKLKYECPDESFPNG